MTICRATKRNGEPCRVAANSPDEYCWAHSPRNAEQRRKAASRAGSARLSKELTRMKEAVREVIAKVEGGELERNSAAVILQGYRVLKDLVELERKVREQEEVLQRLDALERRTQGGKIGGDK